MPHNTRQKILILGINGFIGSALAERLLAEHDYDVVGLDIADERIGHLRAHKPFTFRQGDMLTDTRWIETQIAQCDIVLPLVAIATPATYVNDPLKVFHLDFEANLAIIKQVVAHQKRLIFPSTSEVYGMCHDEVFDEQTSHLVLGPIAKERWIYACSKQMLDRVIYAYGKHQGLNFTLFRPFNWIGPQQDDPMAPQPRVVPQFIGNLMRGEPIKLVEGGKQRRTFLDIREGISGLIKIIENRDRLAEGEIFNLGHPGNDYAISDLAAMLLKAAKPYANRYPAIAAVEVVNVPSAIHYGEGYQDVSVRVPAIERAKQRLQWTPKISLEQAIENIVDYYFKT